MSTAGGRIEISMPHTAWIVTQLPHAQLRYCMGGTVMTYLQANS